jgi:hypothetical protein
MEDPPAMELIPSSLTWLRLGKMIFGTIVVIVVLWMTNRLQWDYRQE